MGAVAVFGHVASGRGGAGGEAGFCHFGEGFAFEIRVEEVGAVEVAEAFVFVDFGGGFELAGAEVAAVLLGIGEGLGGRGVSVFS